MNCFNELKRKKYEEHVKIAWRSTGEKKRKKGNGQIFITSHY